MCIKEIKKSTIPNYRPYYEKNTILHYKSTDKKTKNNEYYQTEPNVAMSQTSSRVRNMTDPADQKHTRRKYFTPFKNSQYATEMTSNKFFFIFRRDS